jgi:hypothetical protein
LVPFVFAALAVALDRLFDLLFLPPRSLQRLQKKIAAKQHEAKKTRGKATEQEKANRTEIKKDENERNEKGKIAVSHIGRHSLLSCVPAHLPFPSLSALALFALLYLQVIVFPCHRLVVPKQLPDCKMSRRLFPFSSFLPSFLPFYPCHFANAASLS